MITIQLSPRRAKAAVIAAIKADPMNWILLGIMLGIFLLGLWAI